MFISAKKGTNIPQLKQLIYDRAKEIHMARFPYNDLLFERYDDLGENS